MWKKILVIMLVVIAITACGKKAPQQDDAIVKTEERFFPVPSFIDLFATLDYLQRADYDNVIPEEYNTKINDVYNASFYLGTLTADAIIATKARNKTKLTSIAHAMIDYSKMIGINEEVLKLADELMLLIQEDKWEDLQVSLDKYKNEIERSLYETHQFDLMTLVQAGGWTEGLYCMTEFIIQNYQTDTSKLLNQKGIVDNLVRNLNQMENKELYNEPWFKSLVTGYDKIFSIIKVENKETFTNEEVEDLRRISKGIKSGFNF